MTSPDRPCSVLVVVAHPDDEVLGAGGLASFLSGRGVSVRACILCGEVDARMHRPEDSQLAEDLRRAADVLGMEEPILGSFPNIRMNTVTHLEVVQFIEGAIVETGADVLVTHHPSDLNDDHRQVSAGTQAAARLPQRRPGMKRISGLHFMEVPSSTDWSYANASDAFRPTSFVELEEQHLERKLEALRAYRGVMRPYPHPRSEEVVRGLAAVRGAQAGMNKAEAFETPFTDLGWAGWA
jgi:LmbE family N-acetylglucosaminyl deacetylase